MIIKKVGASYIYVFPSAQGRIKSTDNPAGKIEIGKTVTVIYALKIMGKARFIGLDGSTISPKLTVAQSDKLFGFMVRDSKQSDINISINPTFMSKLERVSDVQEKMARQGNLSVTLAPVDHGVKIISVVLD